MDGSNPTPAESRAIARTIAEWMGWKVFSDCSSYVMVPDSIEAWFGIKIQENNCTAFEFYPRHSLDSLALVLRKIAEDGLFPLLIDNLSESFSVEEASILKFRDDVNKYSGAMSPEDIMAMYGIQTAMLAPPRVIADAVVAVIDPTGQIHIDKRNTEG